MFSGLTNQVSNWMAKKPENGSEVTGEQQKVASPETEVAADLEKKNNTRYAIPLSVITFAISLLEEEPTSFCQLQSVDLSVRVTALLSSVPRMSAVSFRDRFFRQITFFP